MGRVILNAIGETFEADSRVLNTLKRLFIYPGELSAEFERNRRASYLTPVRLYLFTSILYFFVLSTVVGLPGPPPNVDVDGASMGVSPAESAEELDEEVENLVFSDEELDNLREVFRPHLTPRLQNGLETILRKDDGNPSRGMFLNITGWMTEELLQDSINQRVLRYSILVLESPPRAMDSFVQNLPFGMFALLPWSALLTFLLEFRKHKRFVHHVIFSIHTSALGFVWFSLLMVVDVLTMPLSESLEWIGSTITLIMLVYLAWYYIRSWRTFFGTSIGWTLSKLLVYGLLYSVMILPALALVFVLTLTSL